jgi:hypothetical protein
MVKNPDQGLPKRKGSRVIRERTDNTEKAKESGFKSEIEIPTAALNLYARHYVVISSSLVATERLYFIPVLWGN